jgi:hypothetical protein
MASVISFRWIRTLENVKTGKSDSAPFYGNRPCLHHRSLPS